MLLKGDLFEETAFESELKGKTCQFITEQLSAEFYFIILFTFVWVEESSSRRIAIDLDLIKPQNNGIEKMAVNTKTIPIVA